MIPMAGNNNRSLSSPDARKYLVQNPFLKWALTTIDFCLSFLPKRKPPKREIQRILLSNIAHLGDVVIATSILPAIHRQFPKAKIGFLLHSASKRVLQHHPQISWIHCFDHVLLNRPNMSWIQALRTHMKTRKEALREIRAKQYDLAFDLRCHFPNTIFLLARAKIPRIVGWESGGFGPLLTDAAVWIADQYVGVSHGALFKRVCPLKETFLGLPSYPKELGDPKAMKDLVILHMGSRDSKKSWNLESWKQLAQMLHRQSFKVAFTGQGEKEEKQIASICGKTPAFINLCNQLNWRQFVGVIHQAKLLISCDSVAVHLAASELVPTIVLFAGINSTQMWVPPYEKCVYLQQALPCAPCLNRRGCASMACIQTIPVEKVFSTAMKMVACD